MVKVIEYIITRRVTCKNCGALLEFELGDLKTIQTGMNEYEQQIECPDCREVVTVMPILVNNTIHEKKKTQ